MGGGEGEAQELRETPKNLVGCTGTYWDVQELSRRYRNLAGEAQEPVGEGK